GDRGADRRGHVAVPRQRRYQRRARGINEHDNNGRNVAMKSILTALGLASVFAVPAVAQDFGPPELIAAAKKEGRLVYYTANFAEGEQEVIKAFNKRFPAIKVQMGRAPGGQLITRGQTEAAAGKLSADVVDHSDRALMT